MAFITDFPLFLTSVAFISLSGVLLPGPLFAVTIEKAQKRKNAGVLIALGHGVVEFPLMFLIFFLLSEFEVPWYVQVGVGLVGGLLMIYLGVTTFWNRNKPAEYASSAQDSLLAGIRTTAANPAFILWWLTVGTALILNAQLFGIAGFSVFAGVHWSCDFIWYTVVAFLIFKSYKFWTKRIHQCITFFCVAVLVGFGAWFFASALWQLATMIL
ncbi:MAG: LysE family translocator [Candidatus Bathyarchaeota archaeon]|nr:LysE family translocator [Candidatus Bathyarchaeota archaeon]